MAHPEPIDEATSQARSPTVQLSHYGSMCPHCLQESQNMYSFGTSFARIKFWRPLYRLGLWLRRLHAVWLWWRCPQRGLDLQIQCEPVSLLASWFRKCQQIPLEVRHYLISLPSDNSNSRQSAESSCQEGTHLPEHNNLSLRMTWGRQMWASESHSVKCGGQVWKSGCFQSTTRSSRPILIQQMFAPGGLRTWWNARNFGNGASGRVSRITG